MSFRTRLSCLNLESRAVMDAVPLYAGLTPVASVSTVAVAAPVATATPDTTGTTDPSVNNVLVADGFGGSAVGPDAINPDYSPQSGDSLSALAADGFGG